MTPERIKTIVQDARKLATAMADPDLLPLLPVTLETVRGLPNQLAPFQVKWLFGNCSDEILATLRQLHPEMVAQRFGTGSGTRYRYLKSEACRAAKAPCEETVSTQRRGDAEKR